MLSNSATSFCSILRKLISVKGVRDGRAGHSRFSMIRFLFSRARRCVVVDDAELSVSDNLSRIRLSKISDRVFSIQFFFLLSRVGC